MVSVIHFLVTTKRTNICQELNIVIVPQSLTPCIVIFCLILRIVDSRYLEFDGTMEKIRVNRSSTQEELWKYRKCSLFNDERERT